jgi:hypothetical protein
MVVVGSNTDTVRYKRRGGVSKKAVTIKKGTGRKLRKWPFYVKRRKKARKQWKNKSPPCLRMKKPENKNKSPLCLMMKNTENKKKK